MGLLDIGNHMVYAHNRLVNCLKKDVYHFDSLDCSLLRILFSALSKFVSTTDPEVEEALIEHIKDIFTRKKSIKASYRTFFEKHLDPECTDEITINRIKYFY